MGVKQDGTKKEYWLYKPGDVFDVNEAGWLVKRNDTSSELNDA